MPTSTCNLQQLLSHLCGTPVFVDYCRQHGISFEQPAATGFQRGDVKRWMEALLQLPEQQRIAVELELSKVMALADADAQAHLLSALGGRELPRADIPGGVPLALWVLLRYPAVFHEVFLHQEIRDIDCWRVARGKAGLSIEEMHQHTAALASSLQQFFGLLEGNGQFCAIEAHVLPEGGCFIASVADRVQLLDSFTDSGERTTERLCPAFPVTFMYYHQDGSVLLKSRQRSNDRILDLFQRFGKTVLGIDITAEDLGQRLTLDRLKDHWQLLPDADDMEQARVKCLHLRYPQDSGHRQLKLETLAGDEPAAIPALLRAHVSEVTLRQLQVVYAELQVRLREYNRSRSHTIRLWQNRSNLPQTALGHRFRRCLVRWQLLHDLA